MKNGDRWLIVLAILVVGGIAGPLGYLSWAKVQDRNKAAIEMKLEEERVKLEREKQRTSRSENRWNEANRIVEKVVPWARGEE